MNRESFRIGELMAIPLDQLEIGRSQVRVDASKGIDELAASIAKQGLLEPIVVSKLDEQRYEILTGQRRFLAHRQLGYKMIDAIVVERDVDDTDAKVISLTENLVRRNLSRKELIDACTMLYKRYGSMKMVAQETGLKPTLVSEYVRYDQLIGPLKDMVDAGSLDVKVALQAQKAATRVSGETNEEEAIKFAKELAPMSNPQRQQFVKGATEDPEASVEEKIEKGRRQPTLLGLPRFRGRFRAWDLSSSR